MHIRTDDEVYRVDAVWLGPPRATFPWRARYSAYGVGLLVMLLVMFLQRRLGIDLGFFSVAWALLITVAITRFVSRRINDERPLLEWLTLFVHELRGPRAHQRVTGGALTTGHVTVRRDRPRLAGAPTAVALPRGSDRAETALPARVRADPADVATDVPADDATDDATWGPPPRADGSDAGDAPAVPAPRAEPAGDHLTPSLADAGPSHARATRRGTGDGADAADADAPRSRPARTDDRRRTSAAAARKKASGRTRPRAVEGDFGPPSSADIGAPPVDGTPELPPAADTRSADAVMAAWTRPRASAPREAVPARRAAADPDSTQRRPARPRRRPGWPMSNEPGSNEPASNEPPAAPVAPFGPGTRPRDGEPGSEQRSRRGDPGAAPR
ncbi:hypothetical protein [Actinomycetospora aeridis]|uniref:Uncharacterized protein n=1 Tax=Actinomycetospora aeridis TaxID=3129231 RepID=A0ABU8N8J8_9PSEU